MRRRCIHSMAVAAALGAVLSSLTAFPTLAAAQNSLTKIAANHAAFATSRSPGGPSGVVRSGRRGPDDCTPPEGWLESRVEEEIEHAVAMDAGLVVAIGLDASTPPRRSAGPLDSSQHLAWSPSSHAFSPSVHPVRC